MTTKSVLGRRVIGDEEFARQQSVEVETSALGPRAGGGPVQWVPPADSASQAELNPPPEKAPPEPEDVRMVKRALGDDYTTQQMQAALISLPLFAKPLFEAEMCRDGGPRSRALKILERHFASNTTDTETLQAIRDVLATMAPPPDKDPPPAG